MALQKLMADIEKQDEADTWEILQTYSECSSAAPRGNMWQIGGNGESQL